MSIKQINAAPELEQLPTEHGMRFYKTHTGLKFPSVTTILGVINKPALVPWAAKVERELMMASVYRVYDEMMLNMAEPFDSDSFMEAVVEEAGREKGYQTQLRRAGNIGTNVHNRIDWDFRHELGKDNESKRPLLLTTPEAKRAYDRFLEWRTSATFKVLATERRVVSFGGQYAGTLDTIIKFGSKVGVLDFKTGKRVYFEAFLQNCAYRMALAEEGIKTDTGWIILLPKERDDQAFEVVEVPPLSDLISTWQGAVILYRGIHAAQEGKN